MNKTIKQHIKESWSEYCATTPTFFINAKESHDKGWMGGAEWMLTELAVDKQISQETLKKYMKLFK